MSLQTGFIFTVNATAPAPRPQPKPLPSACMPDASFEDKVALAITSLVDQMKQGRHLVVATSMGKDSSVLCAITVLAIEQAYSQGIRVPHVCFAHSATGYDNPVVDGYASKELGVLKAYLAEKDLPASVAVQRPSLTNDYVVNMIGGRMIATMPGTDRSCATMLKVSTSKQLKKRLNYLLPGEVVNVVGKRWDESAWR